MAELSLVRTLFIKLLQLDDEDAGLPLPVLVNLHRRQLRAPLEAVARLAADPDTDISEVLQGLYPHVSGNDFSDILDLALAETAAERFDVRPDGVWRRLQQQGEDNQSLMRVIDMAQTDWLSYEPALALYEITFSPLPLEAAGILEVELKANAAVHPMLVDLCRRGMSGTPATLGA
jgi:hypothetical protein